MNQMSMFYKLKLLATCSKQQATRNLIMEQEQNKKRAEFFAKEEQLRKKDPTRYGGPIRGNRTRIVDVRTPWKNLFETPKTEYDETLENAEDAPGKKYYW